MSRLHSFQPTYTLFLICGLLLLGACQKDGNLESVIDDSDIVNDGQNGSSSLNLPSIPYDYEGLVLPDHFLTNDFPASRTEQSAVIDNDNMPTTNPITNEGATLGRVLFYDKNLSANGTVSCGSCHEQEIGFSDANRLSTGFAGGLTRRHSMGLTNARFYQPGKFFWDERAATLEEQVLGPIQDAVEMGLTLEELIDVVETQEYYAPLFVDAFGDDAVTADRISKALAQFVRSLVSVNSRYDQGRSLVNDPFDNFPNFSALENRGKEIFMERSAQNSNVTCLSCHQTESFLSPANFNPGNSTTSTVNIGLDRNSNADYGVYETTGNTADIGKFKVPSLRNIEVTEPYMHDGRFDDLRDVIRFYSRDIENHAQLDSRLRDNNGNPVRFNINGQDADALLAFLNTLTDQVFLTDEKFSDPFEAGNP